MPLSESEYRKWANLTVSQLGVELCKALDRIDALEKIALPKAAPKAAPKAKAPPPAPEPPKPEKPKPEK